MSVRSRFRYTRRTLEDHEAAKQMVSGGNRETFTPSGVPTYSRPDGDNIIRILPPAPSWAEEYRHYGVPVYRHFQVGPDKSIFLCPWKMRKEPCPICDEFRRAKENGDDELASNFRASAATMVWLLDRAGKDPTKPLLWFIPSSLDREILEQARDKKRDKVLPIDDPFEGYDVMFTYDKKAAGAKKYAGVTIDRDSTPIAESDEDIDSILEYIMDNPLPDMLIHHSSGHIAHVFSGGAIPETSKGETSRSDDDEDNEDKSPKRHKPSPEAETSRTDDVEEDESPFKEPIAEEEEEEEEKPERKPAKAAGGPKSPAERRAELAKRFK